MLIETDVPMPFSAGQRGRPALYPWAEMNIGDSFFADGKALSDISPLASIAGKKSGKKFSCRTEGSGVRVWRIQ